MPDKKLTDNEIIKALECCIKAEICDDCKTLGCPAYRKEGCYYLLRSDGDFISDELNKDALSLINRQKAEIERLKENLNIELENYATEYDNKIKSEAIKEFADRLEKKIFPMSMFDNGNYGINAKAVKVAIERVKKEMVGDDK